MTYQQTLADILNAIANSSIYKTMLDDREIEKRDLNDLLVRILPNALAAAESLTLNAPKAEEELKLLQAESALADDFAAAKLLRMQKEAEEATARVALVQAQTEVETSRKALLDIQKDGFLDNRIIKLTGEIRGLVAEIEAGGLTNPQANWDLLYASFKALAKIAEAHPTLGGEQIIVPDAPPAPQN